MATRAKETGEVMERFTHICVRPFTGAEGRAFQPGDIVDASGWRNTAGLVARRYLEPLTGSPAKVFQQQRAEHEEALERLAAEERLLSAEVERTKTEAAGVRHEISAAERVAATLPELRKKLQDLMTRYQAARERLGIEHRSVGSIGARTIPIARGVVQGRLAFCEKILGRLTATA